MKSLLAILFLTLTSVCLAQTGTIKGIVLSEADKKPVEFAAVKILRAKDSTMVTGSVLPVKGNFELSVNRGKYILDISFMGYENYIADINVSKDAPVHDLGTIYLKTRSIELEETVITAQVPDIVVKGDTIEYNAGGYKVDEGSVLQDLIKKIPGLEIDSKGNLSANGKPISKILVDGKEFFSDDIRIALENLPVEMIEKLQLYKEESEMSKLTGFKDGEEEQVLNLLVKEEIKQSIFGNVEAGYGTEDRYNTSGIANYMKGENQFSILGEAANVPAESYLSMNGLETNRNVGGRLNIQKSEKFSINSSVFYRYNKNEDESFSNSQTFLTSGDRFNTQKSRSVNTQNSFNANSYVTWKPDSMTNIYFRIDYRNSLSENNNNSTSQSYVVDKDTTNGWRNNFNKTTEDNISSSLTIGRKLNKKGRSINLSLNTSFRDSNTDGTNWYKTIYGNGSPDDTRDQIQNSNSNSLIYGLSVSYVEPIGKNNFLQARYNINRNISERDRNTLREDQFGEYSEIDTAYTRYTKNEFTGQNVNLSFQSRREKYNYTIGFSVNPSYSASNIWFKDSLIEKVSQSVVNYSPNLRFSYTPTDKSSFNIDYNGYTTRPSLSQLSADTVIVNAQNKTVGNPNLKPSYNNSINVYYMKSDFEKQTYLNISANFGFMFNNIVNNSVIDSVGNTTTTYSNVNGNLSANLNVMYSTPFRNKKFNFSTSTYGNFYRNNGFTNGEETVTNNLTIGESLNLSFSSDKFNFYVTPSVSYSVATNNLTSQKNISSTGVNMNGSFSWTLPLDFKLSSDVSFSYNDGYSSDFKKTSLVWNATLSKLFLRKKKGTLKFSVYDILDDRNNVMRSVTGSGITDNRTNTINRYCMLSFIYKFNIFKGGGSNQDNDVDYMYDY
ncbi:outer membrane beta-barrel protein [Dysgonomonas sp. 520]|uniref:outer membrane beta-barrel protein n=1 Tax=Dysgonomonas sp. 520 TaxID=2302931 RepID=UPI0013D260F1|nr:outer membrane beta-barrel protein [Dysgonomonas sp. 520]NDW08774.1 TonB-dependent receptor [Dysgonomonas sp. 520]